MYPAGGRGHEMVESRPGGGGEPARDRWGRSVRSGDPGQKASGIQALGNHTGESPPLETLYSQHCIARARLPREEILTWAECGAGTPKSSDARKPGPEVARETTTPTRPWGCLAYGSPNPMQQLCRKPAWPTIPSNPCSPFWSSTYLPEAVPHFPLCACARARDAAELLSPLRRPFAVTVRDA